MITDVHQYHWIRQRMNQVQNSHHTQFINVPELVTSEDRAADKEMVDPGDTIAHPLTGMTQRYVLGDRFHAANNPHKSPLCRYHNINLLQQSIPSRQATRSRKTTRKMYDDSEVYACKISPHIFTIT